MRGACFPPGRGRFRGVGIVPVPVVVGFTFMFAFGNVPCSRTAVVVRNVAKFDGPNAGRGDDGCEDGALLGSEYEKSLSEISSGERFTRSNSSVELAMSDNANSSLKASTGSSEDSILAIFFLLVRAQNDLTRIQNLLQYPPPPVGSRNVVRTCGLKQNHLASNPLTHT